MLETHLAALAAKGIDVDARRDDLELAFACGHGDASAVRRFHEAIVPRMRRALARIRLPEAAKEEVLQTVIVRVLVGAEGGRATILDYQGRAPLASWACTVATRAALDEARRSQREISTADTDEPVTAAPPELAHLGAAWRLAFKVALEEAITNLPFEDRAMLRMHFVEGKTLDAIAAAFRAHPTTVSRHLANTRREITAKMRDGVAKRLGVSGSALESIEKACASGLDLSMSRVLAQHDPLAGLASESGS